MQDRRDVPRVRNRGRARRDAVELLPSGRSTRSPGLYRLSNVLRPSYSPTALRVAILRFGSQRAHRALDACCGKVCFLTQIGPADKGAGIGAGQQSRAPGLDLIRRHPTQVWPALLDVESGDQLKS